LWTAREIDIDGEHYATYSTLQYSAPQSVQFLGASATQLHNETASFGVSSFRIEEHPSRADGLWSNLMFGVLFIY